MATVERCLNCRSAVGMASFYALGLWDGDSYLGGLCSNCKTPENIDRYQKGS